jgi:hypothetical protein
MDSNWVCIETNKVDFLALMKQIDSIKSVKPKKTQTGDNVIYTEFIVTTINGKHYPKLRIIPQFYCGSCDCEDYYMRKKKIKQFCKHILATIDYLNQEIAKKKVRMI